jgi:hypothetical protein
VAILSRDLAGMQDSRIQPHQKHHRTSSGHDSPSGMFINIKVLCHRP